MHRKIITSLLFSALLAAGPATQPAPLQISKQTTYITSPLYSDGTPDYVSALNNIASQNVTPQNNAAITLLRLVVGMNDQGGDVKKSLAALGLPESQTTELAWEEAGNFFQEHLPEDLAEQKVTKDLLPGWSQNLPDKPADLFENAETQYAMNHPWTSDKCLLLYAYLFKVGPSLDALQQASELKQFYAPMTGGESFATVIESMMAWQFDPDQVFSPLVWRATLDLGQNDVAGCEQNLLAIHRYARLIAAQPVNPITYMAAFQVESIAAGGDRVLLSDPSLTQKQAQDYLKTLQSLGPMPPVWPMVNVGIRYPILDVVSSYYRKISGIRSNDKMPDVLSDTSFTDLTKLSNGLDWNGVFRRTNQAFDVLTDYFHYADDSAQGPQASAAYDKLEKQAEQFDLTNAKSADDKMFWGIMTGLNILGKDDFVSILRGLELYGEQVDELTQIGLALAAYHAEHGNYPSSLTDLSPEYFSQTPMNVFDNKPLSYTRTSDGYKLVAQPQGIDTDMLQGANVNLLTVQVPMPIQQWESDSLP